MPMCSVSFSLPCLLFFGLADCIVGILLSEQIPQQQVTFQASLKPSRKLATLLFALSPSLARWSQVPSVAKNSLNNQNAVGELSPTIAMTSSRVSPDRKSVALPRSTQVKMQTSLRVPMPIENLMVTVLGNLLGPKLFVRVGNGIEIREVKGKGRGVFATRNIPVGVYLGRYTGKLLTEEGADNAYDSGESSGQYNMEFNGLFGDPLIIDGEDPRKSSWPRFINHSKRKANCFPVPLFHSVARKDKDELEIPLGVYIETKRPISAGEELLFDYGQLYWDSRFPIYDPRRVVIDYL